MFYLFNTLQIVTETATTKIGRGKLFWIDDVSRPCRPQDGYIRCPSVFLSKLAGTYNIEDDEIADLIYTYDFEYWLNLDHSNFIGELRSQVEESSEEGRFVCVRRNRVEYCDKKFTITCNDDEVKYTNRFLSF